MPVLSRAAPLRGYRHGTSQKMVSVLMVIISPNTSVWSCVALFVAAILSKDCQWPFITSSENDIVTATNTLGLLSPQIQIIPPASKVECVKLFRAGANENWVQYLVCLFVVL
jgi:hypothetical protein